MDKQKHQQIIDQYIERIGLYEEQQPIAFDLRGYAAYVKEHKLKASEITMEIMQKFAEN